MVVIEVMLAVAEKEVLVLVRAGAAAVVGVVKDASRMICQVELAAFADALGAEERALVAATQKAHKRAHKRSHKRHTKGTQ